MQKPLISVIIVTWNRKEDVLETIQTVYDQEYSNFEIVIVDNGSDDGTCDAIQENYPGVMLVPLDYNSGPTEGRNIGAEKSTGDILFFLDSDASLASDTLTVTVAKFSENPQVGIIACKVVNASTMQLDNIAGWVFSANKLPWQDREFISFSFSECGCAMRRTAFFEAGGFWDFLFFGREGEELGLRVWDAGYQILYYPKAKVFHRVSPRKRVKGGNRDYYDLRNCLYVYLVRYPWWMLVRMMPLKIGVSLFRGSRENISGNH